MKRQHLAILTATLLIATLQISVAAMQDDGDDDSRLVDARVVEVTEHRVSVIAQTGVEHVIAINDTETRILLNGKSVESKDLRKGDVVTIELDDSSQLKFARQIKISVRSNSEMADAEP